MRLYHGSNAAVIQPLVAKGRPMLDFGQGFYLTSYQEQTANWARRRALRAGGSPMLNVYEFDNMAEGLRVLEFGDNDAAWVEFVCACRRGGTGFRDYDLIVGGVADDKVFAAVDFYARGLWGMEQTLEALRYYRRNDQYCIVSQWVVDERLKFMGLEEVRP